MQIPVDTEYAGYFIAELSEEIARFVEDIVSCMWLCHVQVGTEVTAIFIIVKEDMPVINTT